MRKVGKGSRKTRELGGGSALLGQWGPNNRKGMLNAGLPAEPCVTTFSMAAMAAIIHGVGGQYISSVAQLLRQRTASAHGICLVTAEQEQ